MRIAILGDIHGNLHAFEAALAHAKAQSPDHLVLLGDYVNGCPDSVPCWQLARSLGACMVRGNHERYVSEFGTDRADAQWASQQWLPLQWTVSQFSAADKAEMRTLALTTVPAGCSDVLFMHGSPVSDVGNIGLYDREQSVVDFMDGHTARLFVRGHTHVAMQRQHLDQLIVTNGSVGLPLSGHTHAEYAVADLIAGCWTVRHIHVSYDHAAALRRFHDTGWMRETGVMGRMYFLEAKLAGSFIAPFLRLHRHLSTIRGFNLEQSFEAFWRDR